MKPCNFDYATATYDCYDQTIVSQSTIKCKCLNKIKFA